MKDYGVTTVVLLHFRKASYKKSIGNCETQTTLCPNPFAPVIKLVAKSQEVISLFYFAIA